MTSHFSPTQLHAWGYFYTSIFYGDFGIVTNMKVILGAVLIGVKDIMKSKVFYENVFGITFDEVRPPFSAFTLNGIEFQIEENTPERGVDWDKKYLGTPKGFCFETDNIEEFLSLVEQNGGNISQPLQELPWGYREAHFTDIDGNDFIIEQKL